MHTTVRMLKIILENMLWIFHVSKASRVEYWQKINVFPSEAVTKLV